MCTCILNMKAVSWSLFKVAIYAVIMYFIVTCSGPCTLEPSFKATLDIKPVPLGHSNILVCTTFI